MSYKFDDFEDYPGIASFADPGGPSALRAGPRIHSCPTCGQPNRLSAAEDAFGEQCDECAAAEMGY